MKNNPRMIKLGACDELFPEGTHMCLIYDNDEERRESISKFIKDGLCAGERVGFYFDTINPGEVHDWIDDLDVKSGQVTPQEGLEILDAVSCYCPEGHFDPDDFLERMGDFCPSSLEAGFSGSRVTGEMTWSLRGLPGSERIAEYESRFDKISIEQRPSAICQYDARKFNGATLLQILKVHPHMIVHGQIVRNPYYQAVSN
ncbi:MAG: hypothetical protein COC19_06020 [SAR86 cluster bacterium]|uniref:MEDS domain-containing protein n=1 Tax=SAR86 cluster bacterium TaxID=2030880 RepID=A0A2A4MKU6_9GAMM|nr:MAG: hypothetical protein COC19_06020 [SAR86 cluster bacterium]